MHSQSNARVLKTRHKAVISRISFQERFLRSVSSSSSGSACACEWTLEIGRFREWGLFREFPVTLLVGVSVFIIPRIMKYPFLFSLASLESPSGSGSAETVVKILHI